ncbi:mitochondrial nicotinamide adenine dinucleotide transporter SLC25A51 isoform X2 [Atheta coriaria]
MIFRQMLDGISMKSALLQLHNEGIYFLYRGMAPPLAQKTLSLSVMFGMYENIRRPLNACNVNDYTAKFIAAMLSGTAEVTFMPFERVQTLLSCSAYHLQFRNMYHAFRVVGTYGFTEYYRGIVPILWRNGPSNACFFIARDEVNKLIPPENSVLLHTVHGFVSGAVIGAVTSSIFYPLNVVKISMQSTLGGRTPNMFVAFKQIYVERGGKIRYIYTGIEANLIRAFLGWGVMNAAYGYMRRIFFE